MENLYDYCENILIDIKKSRGYIESGEYLNGNIVINIIKTSLLKKVNKKLESIDNYIKNNFVLVICLIIMITLPITLRQILFYLFNVRLINKTSLSMEEINLNEKLKKTNIKL